ncbi:hypothetical protein MSP8887_03124 [Marinomonas spartinae]|uniref:Uncharacterized protein n=1 Tax=Marinomonas spartinae TaxID=1792290 RepID=A0A1A8TMP3_9GAMM|nr:helix-turn-helix transcriptional regulator [Marinomonas spartinae]SBS33878.1 hypothetical protein MSP8886_02879 [Marinomonas spartinae]SBS38033.1 hypothetical protein MSP8887_03124 [Marinomonas spartinae]
MNIATDEELLHIEKMLENLDIDIAFSMSYVRKTQNLSFRELSRRFSGIDEVMWKRYMQPSYPSTRPIHIVAAYSWVTMVPMTSFYKGLKIRESYRGMDNEAVDALICSGRIPTTQFNLFLNIIYNFLDPKGQDCVDNLKQKLIKEKSYSDTDIIPLPPYKIDIKKFSRDYYKSIAIEMKKFRIKNNFSYETMAKVLGVSLYKYSRLEEPNTYQTFSMSLGARLKLGFKVNSHVDFTSNMVDYPEFHQLRIQQNTRDQLIVESLKHLSKKQKRTATEILKKLAEAYICEPYR